MKTVWKWIIGIVIVLVIVAALVGGAFFLRSHLMNVVGVSRLTRPSGQFPRNGQLPSTKNGNGQPDITRRFPGMMPFGIGAWGWRGMYMGGNGMMGFGRMMPFGGLFGGLVSFGILVLIVLAIIWLIKNLRKPEVAAQVAPVAVTAATHPCPKCGEPVQAEWKFCPHCGEKF